MNILFISHGFPPQQHSGTFRSEAFARYLPEFGIQPIVLCAEEPFNIIHYQNYEDSVHDSNLSGCNVYRYPWKVRHTTLWHIVEKVGLRFPLINTLITRYQRSRFEEQVGNYGLSLVKKYKPRIIYASSPPCQSLILARYISAKTGLPYICDLRDPWTYFSSSKYRTYFDFLLEKNYEKKIHNKAYKVIANTETAKRQLVEKIGVDINKVVVINNGYDDDDFDDNEYQDKVLNTDFFNIVYSGLISPSKKKNDISLMKSIKKLFGLDYKPVDEDTDARSPRYLLKSFNILFKKRPDLAKKIRFHLVGPVNDELKMEFENFGDPNVIICHGAVSRKIANKFCNEGNLVLLMQISMKIHGVSYCTAIPGKLFNYMRAQVPILALMENNDAAKIIRDVNAGVVIDIDNIQLIADSLEHYVDLWASGVKINESLQLDKDKLMLYGRRYLTFQLSKLIFYAAKELH